MRPSPALRLGLVLAVVLVGSACTDDDKPTPPPGSGSLLPGEQADASVGTTTTPDAGAVDTTPDAATKPPRAACVDRPGDLPQPPSGELPCELLPPGFSG